MFTSGSTGRPKGVSIPYRAIRNLVTNPDYVQLGPDDRVAYVANPSFDASLFEIWGALLMELPSCIWPGATCRTPTYSPSFSGDRRISIVFLTTALFNLIAKRRPSAFQSVQYVLFGGERASVEAVREVYSHSNPAHLVNVYGPTECTTFSTFYTVDCDARGDRSAYRTAYQRGRRDIRRWGRLGHTRRGHRRALRFRRRRRRRVSRATPS